MKKHKQGEREADVAGKSSDNASGALGVALIIGGLIVLGYGVYKATPHVVKWWKDRVLPKITGSKKSAGLAKTPKTMLCPACGGTMELYDDTSVWKCNQCDYSISDEELDNGLIFWFCDKCEAFMNIQPGFSAKSGSWVCSKCGFDNDVTEASIEQ